MTDLGATVNLLSLFAEPTRVRLLALLSREELTVAELTKITELSQSRVSTHLGKLRDAGLLRDRREGASTYYAASGAGMPAEASAVWSLLDAQLDDVVIEADRDRCENLLAARESAAPWPDWIAGQMERHYSSGRTWEATTRGLLGFVRLGRVLDVGAGDGAISQLLAGRADSVTCVDRSQRIIEAALKRLSGFDNVRCLVADMHELPFTEPEFDQVLLFNVLTYAHSPERALGEAARVLARGGRLAVVTLDRHERVDVTAQYNHLQPGFSPDELQTLLGRSGFAVEFCEITSRERRKPNFRVLTAFATNR